MLSADRSDERNGDTRPKLNLNKAICASIDVDQVWNSLGGVGKYQVMQTIFLSIACLGYSPAVLSNVFVGKYVEFQCSYNGNNSTVIESYPSNSSVRIKSCSVQIVDNESRVLSEESCETYDYATDIHTSFVSEWNTVCDRETISQMPQMFVMIGMAVGASLLPSLGDRYGRKRLTSGSQALMCLVMIGMAFVPNIKLFLFLGFLAGAFNQGFMVGVTIQMIELYTTELRSVIGIYSVIMWAVSVIFLIPFAYIMRNTDWRMLQLAYGLISAPIFILFWVMDDSLRWLVSNSKLQGVKDLLIKACGTNGKNYEDIFNTLLLSNNQRIAAPQIEDTTTMKEGNEVLLSPIDDVDIVSPKASQPQVTSLSNMLKNRCMVKTLVIFCLSWTINSQIYYGLTLLSITLAGIPYLNFLIGAALEIPSTLLSMYTLNKYGRKNTIIAFITAAGFSLLTSVLLETLAPNTPAFMALQTAFTLLGKFHISGSFNSLWIYTPELYPTNLRNKGVGFSSSCGRIGAIASPFFHILAHRAKWAPGVLFSVGAFVCAFLISLLPETRWRELPHTIEQVEAWFEEDKQSKSNGRH